MRPFRLLSAAAQVAARLRQELFRGTWTSVLPGVSGLAADLGVNHKTVEAALRQLEQEGWLVSQGTGRARLIRLAGRRKAAKSLRVAILLSEVADRQVHYLVELRHQLLEAGHVVHFAAQSLDALEMKVARVARLVQRTDADAWVVEAAARPVLEWFSTQPVPAFALFGRRHGLAMAGAGPDKVPATVAATRALLGLGHRRLVLLIRRRHRWPQPGPVPSAFLDELKAHGIQTGAYHLPDWEESPAGFQACLTRLFALTPPTALILDEVQCFVAAHQFLAQRRLRVPQDVSLVSTDDAPAFIWCEPAVAHIRWDPGPVVRRVVRWAAHVSAGQRDVRPSFTPARFVPGGTIGPAPVERFISPLGTGIT